MYQRREGVSLRIGCRYQIRQNLNKITRWISLAIKSKIYELDNRAVNDD